MIAILLPKTESDAAMDVSVESAQREQPLRMHSMFFDNQGAFIL
jgi:hypothetical protein